MIQCGVFWAPLDQSSWHFAAAFDRVTLVLDWEGGPAKLHFYCPCHYGCALGVEGTCSYGVETDRLLPLHLPPLPTATEENKWKKTEETVLSVFELFSDPLTAMAQTQELSHELREILDDLVTWQGLWHGCKQNEIIGTNDIAVRLVWEVMRTIQRQDILWQQYLASPALD